jgi:hypothetical protein
MGNCPGDVRRWRDTTQPATSSGQLNYGAGDAL